MICVISVLNVGGWDKHGVGGQIMGTLHEQ